MKLTEVLQGIGRPIAFYPGLRRITGSTTASVLLCQLLYWTGKEAAGDGWIFKTSEELTEETGLSYDEQSTARKHLAEKELLEERYARLEHKMYFRVCIEQINTIWENGETGISAFGKDALPNSLNGTTENTAEIINAANKTVDAILRLELDPKGLAKIEMQKRFEAVMKINPGWDGVIWRDFDSWLMAQERKGRKIEDWAAWWNADDFRRDKQRVNLNPSKIKQNWNLAFESEVTVTRDSDGGMYV